MFRNFWSGAYLHLATKGRSREQPLVSWHRVYPNPYYSKTETIRKYVPEVIKRIFLKCSWYYPGVVAYLLLNRPEIIPDFIRKWHGCERLILYAESPRLTPWLLYGKSGGSWNFVQVGIKCAYRQLHIGLCNKGVTLKYKSQHTGLWLAARWRPYACVIAQQNSSVTFVSLRWHSRIEICSALKIILPQFFYFLKIRQS